MPGAQLEYLSRSPERVQDGGMVIGNGGATYDFWLVNSRSWWIATELCRRHARLSIGEWQDGGKPQDSLGIYDEVDGRLLVDINRAGDIWVAGALSDAGTASAKGTDGATRRSWSQVFASPAFATVLALEAAAGLRAPSRRLRTAGPLLGYRVVTAVVGRDATSSRPYDVRSAFPVGPRSAVAEHLFRDFPEAGVARRTLEPVPFGEATRGFWAFRHDGEAAHLLDPAGTLYSRDRDPVDLHAAYQNLGRDLWRLVGEVFGGYSD